MGESVTPSDEPERWLPIPDWEGLYEVSDLGRVRSLTRWTPAGTRKGRILKHCPDDTGRFGVVLSVNGECTNGRVSVLVALAFLGPRPDGLVVCHNDGNLANNKLSNLRYDTQRSNLLDRQIHGTDPQQNKTHCPKGHPYDEENTRYGTGPRSTYRICRICDHERGKRRRDDEKALRGTEPKRHGTLRGYVTFGCRCDRCSEAGAAAAAVRRRQYEATKRKRKAA